MINGEVILEYVCEEDYEDCEDEFWNKLEKRLQEMGLEVEYVSDMETEWYVLPSSVTDGHGYSYQEIGAIDKQGNRYIFERISECFFGQTIEKVKFVGAEVE